MVNMSVPPPPSSSRRDQILDAAIGVFGRLGYRKTSVEDLAHAAGISKQGLYLHYAGKEEIFRVALGKYLDDGLERVRRVLDTPGVPLGERLLGALDGWFGQHLATFVPAAFDVIFAGDTLAKVGVERYKAAFQDLLRQALARATTAADPCGPAERAQVLYLCGLSWKDGKPSRAEFRARMELAIRACVPTAAEVHPFNRRNSRRSP
jgi:AcrR family transcriptional regulator